MSKPHPKKVKVLYTEKSKKELMKEYPKAKKIKKKGDKMKIYF